MVEVHEPARLLVVVEQSLEVLDKACNKMGALKEWIDNEWVRFVACDPKTRDLFLYSLGGWEAIEFPHDCEVPSSTHSEHVIVGRTETIPVHQFNRRHA
ncbi:MAG: putative inorganic carbon transporter subunit DabA [Methylococcales bacterium]